MTARHMNVVLVHGAWADGSSWSKVIGPLTAAGIKVVVAAPLPLTSLADDTAAVARVLDRLEGPAVLAGHAYGGAVIAETRHPNVAPTVSITGIAPAKSESVSDVLGRLQAHPNAPAHELGHSGISLLSLAGPPIEEVACIAGHSTTVTTQRVYRRGLRPVLAEGVAAIDKLFG